MGKKVLNEAFVLSKKLDNRGNNIAYIDPNKPENKETFKYKDVFKRHGAKWGDGYWFWYIGKTGDQWRNVYSKMIEPALKDVHKLEGASEEESTASLVASLDAVINEVKSAETSETGEGEFKPIEKTELVGRLDKFKEMLVNLDNDEEFKKTMQTLTALKNAQGHQYSFMNTILVWIQNPKATIFKSEINWNKYNRNIINKDERMMIRSPSRNAMRPYSPQDKERITTEFLKSVGKMSVDQLGVGEKERLSIKLRGSFSGNNFDFTPVYDISNTSQIEGKEDLVSDLQKKKDIKWFEEDMISEEVKPIYTSLLEFAKENGITVDLVDDMNGARGMSKNGSIDLLKNEGNNVGVTKTLAHEITHEILHQRYLKDNNPKFKEYFIGTSDGRGLVEQQAEISAWLIMASYGFDLKTTSLNYAAVWGADKNQMIKVFDMVSGVVNMLLDYINSRINGLTEGDGGITPAKHITASDVANFLGVKPEFDQVKREVMVEQFFRTVKKII